MRSSVSAGSEVLTGLKTMIATSRRLRDSADPSKPVTHAEMMSITNAYEQIIDKLLKMLESQAGAA